MIKKEKAVKEKRLVGRPVLVGVVQAYQIYLTQEMKNYVLSQDISGSSFIRKLILDHMSKETTKNE